MTPKEKAMELYGKMFIVSDPMGNYPMCFDTSKQCAIIAVELVISDTNSIISLMYWQQVKLEIEAL